MLNKFDIHIAISGQSGCGNTTVSKKLAERTGLAFVNYTFRSIAKEDGLSFEEVSRLAESSDEYDLRVDANQVKLARRTPSVLGSRLAIWMIKEAQLKVFLTASLQTRSKRISKREGASLKETMAFTEDRDKKNHNRYLRLYNINNHDYSIADLVINTDRFNADQVVDIIETAAIAVSLARKSMPADSDYATRNR